MFHDVPVRVWLYIALAAAAFAPATHLLRHFQTTRLQREILKAPSAMNTRSPALLTRNVVALGAIVALATFIATPAAERFAKSPSFWPILMIALGLWVLSTVVQGYVSGAIEPMTRGGSWTFYRNAQPKRFWASMVWNALLGSLSLFIAYQQSIDGPKQAIRDQCYNGADQFKPSQALAACNTLINDLDGDRKSDWLAARGSAYYLLQDYERALADYRTAVSMNPQDSSSYFNIGLVYEQRREWRMAADAYSAAIKADPNNTEALERQGVLHSGRGTAND